MTIVFWYWWALAAVLLIFEMMMPGIVFLFLAIGAAVAGALLLIVGSASLELQLFVFAVVAVAAAVVLRPVLRGLQNRKGQGEPHLNARGSALVGQTFLLDQPILGGRGRAQLGDGSWSITGPDMAAGTRVRIAAVSGTELRVEPAP